MNCNYSKEKGSAFTYNELAIKPIHLQILISQPKKKKLQLNNKINLFFTKIKPFIQKNPQ